MAVAPPNLLWMFNEFKRRAPKSWDVRLGGIVGDAAHGYGYHLAPNQLPNSDYSMQEADDRGSGVNSNYSSALDITMSHTGMVAVTNNLLKAARDPDDDRVGIAREFYGQADEDSHVEGLIHDDDEYAWRDATSDSSHLWHVHIGFFRKWNNDKAKLALFLEVLLGNEQDGGLNVSAWNEDVINNLPDRPDAKTNKKIQAGFALYLAMQRADLAFKEAHEANGRVARVEAKLDEVLKLLKGK